MLTEFHLGIDDTDSREGGCTTYTATLVFDALCNAGLTPSDFPWLVRLNPNIPWKTRGNGALAIHMRASDDEIAMAEQLTLDIVEKTSDTSTQGSDPSIALLKGQIPQVLREFSSRALHDVLSVQAAKKVAEHASIKIHQIKGTRGIVGSLAAIGAGLDVTNHSFEIIAYRSRENWGKPRRVDFESVREMADWSENQTFHNIDPETGRVLICPHGPDPVLLGIRGFRPDSLLDAFRLVKIHERVERVMIFRTNQGTDAHLRQIRNVSDLRPFQSAVVVGRVETVPKTIRGGHLVFRLGEETGTLDCVVFKPTGSLRDVALQLFPGDRIMVSGGVRRKNGSLSLNLERLEITQLAFAYREENPHCPSCGGRYESMGKNQGLRCKKCGLRGRDAIKERVLLRRKLGLFTYIPPPRARRHLTRPNGVDTANHSEWMTDSSVHSILADIGQLANGLSCPVSLGAS